MRNNTYQICEYGIIRKSTDFDNEKSGLNELYLPNTEFDSLYNYILANQPLEGDLPFTLFSKGKKLQIKVHNYVGIIETKEGVSLEILPKILKGDKPADLKFTREVFIRMLKCLKDSPFVTLNTAHLAVKKDFPILEVFINSYITEAEKVFGKGLKGDYRLHIQNLNYLKGKILVSQNIKFNNYNHAKFYCEFSELTEDIPQNRIIKSTVLKLLNVTRNYSNYSQLNKLLTHLENVKPSLSYRKDLKVASIKNRLFKPYAQLIEWSGVFLLNQGLTNFKGDAMNTAILFPMEKLFESYIAYLFKKYNLGYKIKVQDRSYFLVETHIGSGKFNLKPDLYIEKSSVQRTIVDTKWKLINQLKPQKNYDIKISDMYQLYAYGKKYSADSIVPHLVIIYPKSLNFIEKLKPFHYDKDLTLNIFPFDFEIDEEKQITEIITSAGHESAKNNSLYSLDTNLDSLAAEDQSSLNVGRSS